MKNDIEKLKLEINSMDKLSKIIRNIRKLRGCSSNE